MSKDRPNRIARIARESASICEALQRFHADKATEFGYSKEVLSDLSNNIQGMDDTPYLNGAEESIVKFKHFLAEKEKNIENTNVASLTYTLSIAVSTSAVLKGYPNLEQKVSFTLTKEPILWNFERIELYAERLNSLNPILGNYLNSVWESYYSGVGDHLRSAMLSMRQLYDHFFSIIAPDREVRDSDCYSPKEEKPYNRVYRIERIRYAARTKIKNRELGEALEEQAKYLLNLYDELNKLHSRNNLREDLIRENLKAMQVLLEQWIDGLK